MNYQEIEAYLLEIPKFTKKNCLQDTKAFLEKLGNPGRNKIVIHVAGTNGKGSVCAYLMSVLCHSGYRTGMFTSPHLVTMRERFQVDGQMISEQDFVECFEAVRGKIAGGLLENPEYHPTFFEMLFFMAMIYFEKKCVEILVLETGLGGRLDATNSLSRKDLCIITEIGLDHVEYLGNSIARIAGEKAGILRKNTPVVYADRLNAASEIIRQNAKALKSKAYPVSKNEIQNLEFQKNFIDFSYKTRYYGYVRCRLNTVAHYQVENASLALCALDVLAKKLPLTRKKIELGMSLAHWEGRMEEVAPGIYVDGAHNKDGIRAFLETVAQDGCEGRRFLLFSVVREKQYQEMIELLLSGDLFSEIYTAPLNNIRGLSALELQSAFTAAQAANIVCARSTEAALRQLMQLRGAEDRIYIAGSLYLVGEIKAFLEELS